jgi:putative peptidoglycan lipid II flippase
MIREGGKLSVLTLVSRVLGLVREMTRAAFMGTGGLADAFTVAFIIPNFLRRLFAEGSVSVAFIPTFTGYVAEGDDKKARDFLSASFTVLVVLVTAVISLGIACTPLIVRLFGSEPGETAILTRIMFPFLGLVSVAALLQGILNSIGIFTPSGLAPILFNVCFIAVPYLIGGWTSNPARAMAIGVVAGGVAQALCQLPAVLRAGWRFGFVGLGKAFGNPGMRRVLALIAPTIIGMAAYQLNDLVCTSLASNAGTGAASSLQYSLRLQELILGIFAVSAGTVLLPNLSESARRADWLSFTDSLGRGMRMIILVTLPVALFSMTVGRDIVILLFRTREFGAESVRMTAAAFFFHMCGLAFIALNRVIAPAFYARSDTKTPTCAGIASFAVNIILAVLLAGPMRGPGIALALSIASAVNTLVLVIALVRAGVPGAGAAVASTAAYFAKILAFSVLAALPILALRPMIGRWFGSSSSRLVSAGLPLVFETLVFALVGLGLLVLTRDSLAGSLVSALKRRGKAGRGK